MRELRKFSSFADMNNELSVILPLFNEGIGIGSSLPVIQEHLASCTDSYEIILVDDGSVDNTWSTVKKLAEFNPQIRALRFTRNFGKESAIRAGLSHSNGSAVLLMDADLQHPPSLIKDLYAAWKHEGYMIAEGVKVQKESWQASIFHRIGAKLFYNSIKRFSGFNLNNSSDFKLIDRVVVDSLLAMPERLFFFRGLCKWQGYSTKAIEFQVTPRAAGASGWSVIKKLQLFTKGITSLSSLPLQIIGSLGVAFMMIAIVLGLQTLWLKFSGHAVDGFTTVILVLLITGSLLMIALSLLGVYVAAIYEEVKKRPSYLISEDFTGSNQAKR